MSVKSTSSVGDASGVVRTGYLKKLRTSKRRKFFVLRAETAESPARLEYYDSDKKYAAGAAPKRAIALKSCFNINKQADPKHKHVIALYTKDDRFCVLFDSDDELDSWLKILLLLQHGDEVADGVAPRPTFEHVWQVNVLKRGLGTTYCGKDTKSAYRLCLTDKQLSLVKKDTLDMKIELDLSSIRSCGNLKTYFFMEVGRNSEIGAGELWMETEDQNIAQNIHHTVYHAMISKKDEDELEPKLRDRASSATESTKFSNTRKPIMTGKFPFQSDAHPGAQETVAPSTSGYTTAGAALALKVSHQRTRSLPLAQPAPSDHRPTNHAPQRPGKRPAPSKCHSTSSERRERCDSMPSRSRAISEGAGHNATMMMAPAPVAGRSCFARPQSYCHQFSPSGSPITPPSAAGSTDSTGSSNSVDECDNWPAHDELHRPIYSHCLTPDEPIAEEDNSDDFFNCDRIGKMRLNSEGGYVDMSPGNRGVTNSLMSPTNSLSSVTSGFTEFNQEEQLRPERTKSVGSTDSKIKLARERAFSCGSKAKKFPEKFFHPHPHPNPKSNSAPLLQSHGDPKSDLMLLDFSSNSTGPRTKNSSSGGYVPMKPGVISDFNHNHDKKLRHTQSSMDSLGYHRPIIKGHEIRSNAQDYVDMRSGSSPKVPSGYMMMDLGRNKKEIPHTSSHGSKKYNSSPLSRSPISPATNDYMDMNCNKNQSKDNSISPNLFESIEFIDSEPKPQPQKPINEGYVEMTPGKGISTTPVTPVVYHQRQASVESTSETDYANMSFGDAKKSSQPIQIQAKPIQNSYFWNKKETPPTKTQLNLSINSNYSSLPRRPRADSRDSSSSSVTTPSSSSIMFPLSLNSPLSPSNPLQNNTNDSDYTVMDYNPNRPSLEEGDYTPMTPGGNLFKPIEDDSPPKDDRSRPSSTSTLVPSRPPSVNSEQLLYASLVLKSAEDELSSKDSSSETVVPTGGFQYAKIDFVKSGEGFGGRAAVLGNAKVKH